MSDQLGALPDEDAPRVDTAPLRSSDETRKAVLGGSVGNFIEQFDFGIYGYMAPFMAQSFFPSTNPTAALLGTYLIYGLSFLIRPLGGVLFGRVGDRIGRRTTLAWSLIVMGVCTAAIGILPTYASIGLWASVLLLVVRVGQGLSQGGEFPGAVAFIVEYAPTSSRGRYTSYLSLSTFIGLLSGSALAAVVTATVDRAAMTDWGWRVPFLVALPLTLVGLFLRLRIRETPEFERLSAGTSDQRSKAPVRQALATQWRPILIFAGFAITNAVLTPVLIAFVPSYISGTLKVDGSVGLWAGTIALAAISIMLIPVGRLTDRFGRKPFLVAACASAIVTTPLGFLLINQGSFVSVLVGELLYIIPLGLISVPLNVSLAEMFPTRLRYSASGFAYNLSFGIFAGSAPLVSALLLSQTGSIWAVVGYVVVIAVVSLVCVISGFRETYRTALSADKFA